MLTYADVCCAIHTGVMAASGAEEDADGSMEPDADADAVVQDADGHQSLTMLGGCIHIFILTDADVWCRMLTYADVCRRMLTYAGL